MTAPSFAVRSMFCARTANVCGSTGVFRLLNTGFCFNFGAEEIAPDDDDDRGGGGGGQ